MKGIRFDVQTKRREEIDDGLPNPPPSLEEVVEVDLKDLKRLLDYARSMGWI